MPAIRKLDNNTSQVCRHRSGSAIDGYEDSNARRFGSIANTFSGPSNGCLAEEAILEIKEGMDQFQMESYVQGLQGHCRVCGMVSPASRNSSLPQNLNGDLCNEIKVSGKCPVEGPGEESSDNEGLPRNEELSHKEFLNGTDSKSTKLVKSRISYFEGRTDAFISTQSTASGVANVLIKTINGNTTIDGSLEERAQLSNKEAAGDTTDSDNKIWKNFPKKQAQDDSKKSKCPFAGKKELKNIRLKNYLSANQNMDNLHLKAKAKHCSANRCMGSLMQPYGGGECEERPYGEPRPPKLMKEQAADFMEQYFTSLKKNNSDAHRERISNIYADIEEKGTYDLTADELLFGAKTAWRNAARCIGRIQWNNLKLIDARSATTAKEMFEFICKHLEYGNNGGNLRSTITIFRERRPGVKDVRIWNSLLIRYAGYDQPDGSVIGDPASVEFTKLCERLGWKGKGGMFDVLPLVLEASGQEPELFEIPEELALQVTIKHPEYPWFEDLGLKWYGLPAVSNMALDVGGIEFTAAPFNGWYMVTEVGARDLGDVARYNMLRPIAERMNLNTKTNTTLWKDRALTELNHAVLYSFTEAKITMIDHHTASETFMKHIENEQKLRGGCPADWVWIVPPTSGSTTEVFHQEMLNYDLKPSYEYQPDAWRFYKFEDDSDRKLTFKQAATMVKITSKLMSHIMARRKKATILFATETGKSESFAKMLKSHFLQAFDVQMFCMDAYDFSKISQENLLLVVTSTFGNGEAPMNGEKFGERLYALQNQDESSDAQMRMSQSDDIGNTLEGVKFAVFGLGSRAYPSFCAFAHSCRKLLQELGGKEIHPIGEGDELSGQEESFKKWASTAFKSACEVFSIDQSNMKTTGAMVGSKAPFDQSRYRFQYEDPDSTFDLNKGLSDVHSKQVLEAKVITVEELQSEDSGRSTILVKLNTNDKEELKYEPGDHLSIFPSNEAALVDKLIGQLKGAPHPDSPIRIEINNGNASTNEKCWDTLQRLPSKCSLRDALTNFIDITSPPTQEILGVFAKQASEEDDRERLKRMVEDSELYEDWKFEKYPNIVEVLEEFPSLTLNGLELLTQLPILQCRYYSISSSPMMYPGEIHVTVAVVSYETQAEPKKVHHGVCSYWLSSLTPGVGVPCYIRQATNFRLPEDPSSPVIMVGPGTGVAPLRSFWQHRQKMKKDCCSTEWGSMDLYFGCRNSKQDDLYAQEKKRAHADGALTNVFLATSREPGVQKTYVQHILKRNSKDVYDKLVNKNGHFYVCGDVTMASEVNNILSDILQENMQISKEQALNSFKRLKVNGHYHEDIFGVTKVVACDRKLDR